MPGAPGGRVALGAGSVAGWRSPPVHHRGAAGCPAGRDPRRRRSRPGRAGRTRARARARGTGRVHHGRGRALSCWCVDPRPGSRHGPGWRCQAHRRAIVGQAICRSGPGARQPSASSSIARRRSAVIGSPPRTRRAAARGLARCVT